MGQVVLFPMTAFYTRLRATSLQIRRPAGIPRQPEETGGGKSYHEKVKKALPDSGNPCGDAVLNCL